MSAPKAEAKQTAVAKTSPIDGMVLAVMHRLEKRQAKLETLLPKGVDVGRFTETIRFALAQEPSLLQCTQESMVLAVMRAARTGLFPDRQMAAIVAYRKHVKGDDGKWETYHEAQFIPMYQGLTALCRATGLVTDMNPVLVHEKDHFVVIEGVNPDVDHKPYIPKKADDARGAIIAAYTRVLLPNGARVVKGLLYADDIDRIEQSVKAKNGPWDGPHRPEMVKKSTLKNAYKTIGVPPGDTFVSLRTALAVDHLVETGEMLPELRRVEEELPSLPSGNDRLRNQILGQNKHLQPVATEPTDLSEDEKRQAVDFEHQLAEPGAGG